MLVEAFVKAFVRAFVIFIQRLRVDNKLLFYRYIAKITHTKQLLVNKRYKINLGLSEL